MYNEAATVEAIKMLDAAELQAPRAKDSPASSAAFSTAALSPTVMTHASVK
jgi:hypothetical protein